MKRRREGEMEELRRREEELRRKEDELWEWEDDLKIREHEVRKRVKLINSLNRYLDELVEEKRKLEPFRQIVPHSFHLLRREIEHTVNGRVNDKGGDQNVGSDSSVLSTGSMAVQGRSSLPQADMSRSPTRDKGSSAEMPPPRRPLMAPPSWPPTRTKESISSPCPPPLPPTQPPPPPPPPPAV